MNREKGVNIEEIGYRRQGRKGKEGVTEIRESLERLSSTKWEQRKQLISKTN